MMILATCFNSDSSKSKSRFEKFIRHALASFGINDVISTEGDDEPLKQLLDRDCGVDAVGIMNGDPIFIASRIIEVKPYGKDYDCFSLRNCRLSGNETELEKLNRKIRCNLPRPHFHVQAFIDDALNLVTVAIVRTRDLVNYIATHKTKSLTTRDGTEFKLATWTDLRRAGVDVRTKKISLQ